MMNHGIPPFNLTITTLSTMLFTGMFWSPDLVRADSHLPEFDEQEQSFFKQPIPNNNQQAITVPNRDLPHHSHPVQEEILPRTPIGKVYLDEAYLKVEEAEPSSYWIGGQVTNHSPNPVYEVRIHYRIHQGLLVVESGHFLVFPDEGLESNTSVNFRHDIQTEGKLEIKFVDWKYANGTQGTSERGIF